MSLEIEAIYENGTLKLDRALPLEENERVIVSVQRKGSRARQSAGMVKWPGNEQELDALLSPDNQPWNAP
jgi:predicted DNA-binding antitoxin AbrB/MazE fold protein